jgi:hypothetical protein
MAFPAVYGRGYGILRWNIFENIDPNAWLIP